MHKDIVFEYPDSVERLGTSPKCENQGMLIPRKLISVQGHPEFTEEIVRELLETRHQQGIFDDAIFKDTMSRVANHHDGVVVAGAFVKFLIDG
jgi:GMP synthase-like glutamine amidotransferase